MLNYILRKLLSMIPMLLIITFLIYVGVELMPGDVIDFLIIALCIFLMIKGMNKLTKKKEEEPAPEPEPSNEEKLLGEIRDLLKKD